jgi:hypothetical protein
MINIQRSYRFATLPEMPKRVLTKQFHPHIVTATLLYLARIDLRSRLQWRTGSSGLRNLDRNRGSTSGRVDRADWIVCTHFCKAIGKQRGFATEPKCTERIMFRSASSISVSGLLLPFLACSDGPGDLMVRSFRIERRRGANSSKLLPHRCC